MLAPRSAKLCWAIVALFLAGGPAWAGHCLFKARTLERVNRQLAGQLVDYTHNHGADRRIWSTALNEPRDLYVYLPPGFDPSQQYPLIIWLHGFMQDEKSFISNEVFQRLDEAIVAGRLPPVIVAVPDGSVKGRPSLSSAGSFFINSRAGNFEDFIIDDVWPFMVTNFPIRAEREAHVLAGISMGGFAAFNLAMKYPQTFKVAVGVFPPLNLRWVDCCCCYLGKFDPDCWGWRTSADRGWEVVGRFCFGLIKIRLKHVIDGLFELGPETVAALSRENPIELIDRLGIKEGLLDMYVAYAGKDEYNIDSQVESFLYRARERGLTVDVDYDPQGRHNMPTAMRLLPGIIDWLNPLLAPYSPQPRP
jgi:S-formylglutathione hydrolase FrmB